MGFKAGHQKLGGRQKGAPNKMTIEVRRLAREFLEDPAYRRSLRQRLIQGRAERLEALLWAYAYGPPPKEQAEKQDEPAAIALQWIEEGAALFDRRMARLVERNQEVSCEATGFVKTAS